MTRFFKTTITIFSNYLPTIPIGDPYIETESGKRSVFAGKFVEEVRFSEIPENHRNFFLDKMVQLNLFEEPK